jgi:hypothetical protein
MPDSQAWTLTETAAVLGVSYWTLKKYRQGSELVFPDGRRIRMYSFGGRRWLVPKVAIDRFYAEGMERTAS